MVILHEKDTWQDCNLIATIGMFDGVHLGHRFLIDELTQTAKKLGKKCAVVTFKDHPQRVFNHTTDLRMIMTLDERLKTIESLGIDAAIVLNFTPEFSKIESRDFIIKLKEQYNINQLNERVNSVAEFYQSLCDEIVNQNLYCQTLYEEITYQNQLYETLKEGLTNQNLLYEGLNEELVNQKQLHVSLNEEFENQKQLYESLNEELIKEHMHPKYPDAWASTEEWDNEWANDREWS